MRDELGSGGGVGFAVLGFKAGAAVSGAGAVTFATCTGVGEGAAGGAVWACTEVVSNEAAIASAPRVPINFLVMVVSLYPSRSGLCARVVWTR